MAILKLNGITKSFGSLTALRDVSLETEEGMIHAIIGPNGAGKTTLLNTITGFLQPNAGAVIFQNKEITSETPFKIARRGIARSFQTARAFNNLSVLNNVMIGLENGMLSRNSRIRRYKHTLDIFLRIPFRRESTESEMREKAKALLKTVGLHKGKYSHTAELSLVNRRRLEIASALGTTPTLLLLDEPTAGMTISESMEIQELIDSLSKRGMTIVLVSHEMRLIVGVAHKVSVINFGEKIAEGSTQEVMNDPNVIRAYLGERE